MFIFSTAGLKFSITVRNFHLLQTIPCYVVLIVRVLSVNLEFKSDSQLQNPLNRVVIAEASDFNFGIEYDREKYKEMFLDASETILGIFGLDRTLYGKPKDKKWWMQLRRNAMIDIGVESTKQSSHYAGEIVLTTRESVYF